LQKAGSLAFFPVAPLFSPFSALSAVKNPASPFIPLNPDGRPPPILQIEENPMDMTDEQRRWWFATHPEFSWNRTRARLLGRRPGAADSPENSNTALANERLRKQNFIQKMMDARWSRAKAEEKWRLSQEHASHAKSVAWAMDMPP
jgi:hypothetical protein